MSERSPTPIPPFIDPILHEEPRLRFETFEYHPLYPNNDGFPVPARTKTSVSMKDVWQPVVDTYWQNVRNWIATNNEDRDNAIARKEKREAEERAKKEAEEEAKKRAEKDRLKRIKDQERDERVAKSLEGRKRKRSGKDVGDTTLKKKKRAPKPKSAPTVVESEDEGESREEKIISANRKWLSERGIEIVDEASLLASHTSSKYSGDPRDAPCNHCRYWVETHGCATWICRDVSGRKACATCTASNISCVTTGEAIQREKKAGGTPKRRASGSKAEEENQPEVFDRLGFMEADLDTLKQTIGELRDLTRVQVLSQLLTYRLFEASSTIRPPGFQEQREVCRRSAMKIFGTDHLGEDEGKSEAIGDEDASGEEDEDLGQADETLGQNEDMEEDEELVLGDKESDKESEEGVETEGEPVTPKAKTAGSSITESEESGEMSGTTSGDEEESGSDSEEDGNYIPVKGNKSGKGAKKN
ncbi:hypothetical protein M422DRAFT_253929 [Sphaerobolus stellatus SS14]|uniref:Uncharacterized protein n=1 Tax=Sphaerobolus stellatus (strain SS14) TaxID=990650 RepID=A0A0C9VWU3_SPHS4|nr:hypothetical protein M422DRAFT_253929 [Sphaerobolus stellatus SS14]